MDEGFTLDEICKMLGEKDLLIFRLQRELARIREQLEKLQPTPMKEEENGN